MKREYKTVEAQAFHLIDEKGMLRAALESKGAFAGLSIFDQKGNNRICLQLNSSGESSISIMTDNSRSHITLSINEHGIGIGIYQSDKAAIAFGMDNESNASMHISEGGRCIWRAPNS